MSITDHNYDGTYNQINHDHDLYLRFFHDVHPVILLCNDSVLRPVRGICIT